MTVIKLNETHRDAVRSLFQLEKYMGVAITDPSYASKNEQINDRLYRVFCSTYLNNLNNFHAYGIIDSETGVVQALISFYESDEEPAWYYTVYRSLGNNNLLRDILDKVIEHNEANGRLKFYTLVHSTHSKLLRRFHWSKYNDERYDYIDEFMVPAKSKCFYTNHWELLYKRFLLPNDSTVRCNFLKQEYRKQLPIGGNL
jgi:hypothetical protein